MLRIRAKNKPLSRWIDLVGWFIFVAWAVFSVAVYSVSDAVCSFGLGAIVFLVATLRYIFGFSVGLNWISIGGLFVIAGFFCMSSIHFPFFALALVACGIMMIVNMKGRRRVN